MMFPRWGGGLFSCLWLFSLNALQDLVERLLFLFLDRDIGDLSPSRPPSLDRSVPQSLDFYETLSHNKLLFGVFAHTWASPLYLFRPYLLPSGVPYLRFCLASCFLLILEKGSFSRMSPERSFFF